MVISQISEKLQTLLGGLEPSSHTEESEFVNLHETLAVVLRDHPNLDITGNPFSDLASRQTTVDISKLTRILQTADPYSRPTPEPLVFRRETPYRSDLASNSVPDWAVGLAPTKSFGPITTSQGLPVWFDFFFPTRFVALGFGTAPPVLAVPLSGILLQNLRYRLQPGSVWVASSLFVKNPALSGFFTGLKIRGGTLELSQMPGISGEAIETPTGANVTLTLDLDQPSAPVASPSAGMDASDSSVTTPLTLKLNFSMTASKVSAEAASCKVFGTKADFKFGGAAPVWVSAVSQVLIPYSVTTDDPDGKTFNIRSSHSNLCFITGRATVTDGGGWLLPAAKIDFPHLGQAIGTGALSILLDSGIQAKWKGLKGGKTRLVHPAFVVAPGLLSVVDFFASNAYGTQTWNLWQNAGSVHHSQIAISLGETFPVLFISSAGGAEAVTFLCSQKSSLDNPVDGDGRPFRVQSLLSIASILQSGTQYFAYLFDGEFQTALPSKLGRSTIMLRNAFLNLTRPLTFIVFGQLINDSDLQKGSLELMFGVLAYLPTLPDPYVSNCVPFLNQRVPAAITNLSGSGLIALVRWPLNPPAQEAPATTTRFSSLAFEFFAMSRLGISSTNATPSLVGSQASPLASQTTNFRAAFPANQMLSSSRASSFIPAPQVTQIIPTSSTASPVTFAELQNRIAAGDPQIQPVLESLRANPLFRNLPSPEALVRTLIDSAGQTRLQAARETIASAPTTTSSPPSSLFGDVFMLLDVSTAADQMGISFGSPIRVTKTGERETTLQRSAFVPSGYVSFGNTPIRIEKLDVITPATYVRGATLPQVSWEPFLNIPSPPVGGAAFDDTIAVTPGIVLHDQDGPATRIAVDAPEEVALEPIAVTENLVEEFASAGQPKTLSSVFSLPFGMEAVADFDPSQSAVAMNRPYFPSLRGALQIKAAANPSSNPKRSSEFAGAAIQTSALKWFLGGLPITGSALGKTVQEIFNDEFKNYPFGAPLERLEICGYGASIFSNWRDDDAQVAKVSQALFNVIVGRTAHEVVQVRSILFPFGVRVVRTITFMRSPSGYVFRSDSGWKAESDGLYEFSYTINFLDTSGNRIHDPQLVPGYAFHPGTVPLISNIREIRDFPDAGTFTSAFTPNQSGAIQGDPTASAQKKWQDLFHDPSLTMDTPLRVEMAPVVFDTDVHLSNVVSGGVAQPSGDFIVRSRRMLGYVQVSPHDVLVPSSIFADLLNFQKGSLGGPVDCIVDINSSNQRIRLSRVDVSAAHDASGSTVFVAAQRGTMILPKEGSWSVVQQHSDTGDVHPLEEGASIPLIQTKGDTSIRVANPADVVVPASKIAYGVLQSTGTQKLLFSFPTFEPNVKKLLSAATYFADAYKLLNSNGPFPNIANATALLPAQRELQVLGEGLLKLPASNLHFYDLLPDNYSYTFIDEPGVLKIYAEYNSKKPADPNAPPPESSGTLDLSVDSAASNWKAALSSIRVVVDLGPFQRLMWVDGNFDAASGVDPHYKKPNLQFSGALKTAKDILLVLEKLNGGDFDNGMNIGMSNSPDNWEYKFDCSQEIPVIKFPSPQELALDPNPPLKLEAGLRVGFYFNEQLSVPTSLNQLMPACGGYVDFFGRLEVMCLSLAVASVYGVGQTNLGIAADTKAGKIVKMRFGFGAEVVVGLPVVLNVAVMYVVGVQLDLGETALTVGASLLYRGSADICDGLVSVGIQIEAAGTIDRNTATSRTTITAQVTFSLDVTVAWVIDISFSDSWQESRQIA